MSSLHRLKMRRKIDRLFTTTVATATFSCVLLLMVLLVHVCYQGWAWFDVDFLTSFPSRFPHKAGIKSALAGSIWVISLTAIISLPLGVGASIYLEEFAKDNWLNRFIQLNIANLAGVPSIVYGMLGLVVFVRALSMGRSIIAAALTLSLLILPVIIIASREALRAVPNSIRQAAMALGATKWQTVRDHILPSSLPGILTGLILAISRAIGETAPLIMLGAFTYVAFVPTSIFDGFTVMPIQIFNWASLPQHDFHAVAAAGIITLLIVLLTMNSIAILIRHRYQEKIKW